MRLDGVLLSGSSTFPHPVLDRLFGGHLEPREGVADLTEYVLVVVDGRLGGDDLAADGIAQRALEAGVAVLVIAPNEGQLAPLASVVGAVSHSPAQAVFIAPSRHEGEERRFEVRALGYPGTWEPLAVPKEGDGSQRPQQPPRPRSAGGGAGTHRESALGHFASHVESRVERGYRPVRLLAFPDGLKWFQTTWSSIHDIEYATEGDEDFTNGPGSFTLDLTIWGFLSRTPDSESTYVITEGTYTLYPGTLASNDEEARAVMNIKLKNGVRPTPAGFVAVDHIPANGTESWNESFSIDISYQDPFGAYQIYTFEANVSQSIGSWSVQNSSAGTLLGSTWFVSSPVNGLVFPDNRSAAFTGSGHVEPFPSASTGTLLVKDASAWRIDGRYSGSLLFETDSYAYGWSIFGTACGALFCYNPEADGLFWRLYPWFEINLNL